MKLKFLFLLTNVLFALQAINININIKNGVTDWKIPYQVYTQLENGKTSEKITINPGATIQFPLSNQGSATSKALIIESLLGKKHVLNYPINWTTNMIGKFPLKTEASCVYEIKMVAGIQSADMNVVNPTDKTSYSPILELLCSK